MEPSLWEKIKAWADPLYLMGFASYYYAECALEMLLRSPTKLFRGQLREQAFPKFWLAVSPPASSSDEAAPMGGSFATLPTLLGSASGVVLELGPGSGSMMKYYQPSEIGSLLCVEPTTGFYDALQKSAEASGLRGKMSILACGAETRTLVPTLSQRGLEVTEMCDTIVSVRSLCSVGHPRDTINSLYSLLRPGGKMIICEHVVNPWPQQKGTLIGRALQVLYTVIGWPYLIGNCRLTRDTIGMIQDAASIDGGWAEVELLRETDWATLPWVLGTFLKKSF